MMEDSNGKGNMATISSISPKNTINSISHHLNVTSSKSKKLAGDDEWDIGSFWSIEDGQQKKPSSNSSFNWKPYGRVGSSSPSQQPASPVIRDDSAVMQTSKTSLAASSNSSTHTQSERASRSIWIPREDQSLSLSSPSPLMMKKKHNNNEN